MMSFKEHIRQASNNLMASKMRSLLAALGILVGTASVVALVSSGELATQKALEQFKALGTDLMSLAIYSTGAPTQASGVGRALTGEVIEDMEQESAGLLLASPYIMLYSEIVFQGHKLEGGAVGVNEHLQEVLKIKLEEGRFVSVLDQYSRFCVLGQNLITQIREFYAGPLMGKQIQLGERIYTIVGIAKEWPENTFFNQNINNSMLIPLSIASREGSSATINNIVLQIVPGYNVEKAEQEIRDFINKITPGANLFFRSASELIKSMQTQSGIFTLLLGLIGGISLLVGGIGVMNVMLVSVAERRREIGIRMAVGARRADIRWLFLVESVMLALFGGIVGMILGVLISILIGYIADWGFGIYFIPIIIGFLVSASTGIFFGFYPAYRASHLDPITTLRYD